jgi:hypothetical protein
LASAKRLQKEAFRAWACGLLFNTVAGLYTLWQLRQREEKINKKEGEGVVESKKLQRYISQLHVSFCLNTDDMLRRERSVANTQLTSDLCDLVIPLTALGFVNFDEGIVGLAGTTSSIIGLLAQWKKTA